MESKKFETYIYCAMENNEIQSTFKTLQYLQKAVEHHNKCNPNRKWRAVKLKVTEVEEELGGE